jgi:hypothetical protein
VLKAYLYDSVGFLAQTIWKILLNHVEDGLVAYLEDFGSELRAMGVASLA